MVNGICSYFLPVMRIALFTASYSNEAHIKWNLNMKRLDSITFWCGWVSGWYMCQKMNHNRFWCKLNYVIFTRRPTVRQYELTIHCIFEGFRCNAIKKRPFQYDCSREMAILLEHFSFQSKNNGFFNNNFTYWHWSSGYGNIKRLSITYPKSNHTKNDSMTFLYLFQKMVHIANYLNFI